MSRENCHVEATMADNQENGDPSSNLTSAHRQAEVPTCIGISATANENTPQQVAASTLLQLQGSALSGMPNGDMNNSTNENRSQFAPTGINCPSINKPFCSKSWENTTRAHRDITNLPVNATQNQNVYPNSDMQNTIASLTGAIDSLQQQQLNMHTRQESITSTLQQVLSALQQLRGYNHSSPQNQESSTASSLLPEASYVDTRPSTGECRAANGGSEARSTSYVNNTEGVPLVYQGTINHTSDDTSNQEYLYSAPGMASQIAAESEHQMTNYIPSCNGAGYRHFYSDQNQGYVGQPNGNRNPRVTFEDYQSGHCDRSPDQLGQPHSLYENRGFVRSKNVSRPVTVKRQPSPECHGLKVPPFNGKEDWKVWINRFEAIAERRNWSEDVKLDNLLPKLQGRAGVFVFTQLSRETLGCYRQLIKELNSRFRLVETEKTFAAKFSKRVQREDETIEEFAADLKRLYAKAYKNRDSRTKQEDLVRRFLDGMRDSDASFEIEFHKEPDNIDEAVYHVVNFIQTRRRNSYVNHGEKRFKKYARRASFEYDCPSGDEETSEVDEEESQVLRVPAKVDKPQPKKTQRNGQQTSQQAEQNKTKLPGQSDSMQILAETRALVQALLTELKNQTSRDSDKKTLQEDIGFVGRNRVKCYRCQQIGHILRDCPNKPSRSGVNTGHIKEREVQQHKYQHNSKHLK